jgi:hypothetical protein
VLRALASRPYEASRGHGHNYLKIIPADEVVLVPEKIAEAPDVLPRLIRCE